MVVVIVERRIFPRLKAGNASSGTRLDCGARAAETIAAELERQQNCKPSATWRLRQHCVGGHRRGGAASTPISFQPDDGFPDVRPAPHSVTHRGGMNDRVPAAAKGRSSGCDIARPWAFLPDPANRRRRSVAGVTARRGRLSSRFWDHRAGSITAGGTEVTRAGDSTCLQT